MEEFFRYNGISLILIVLGLLSVFVTYGAAKSSEKSGHYVSGIPFVGMIFLLIGGLVSTYKPLALLALLDPGPFWTIRSMIRDYKWNKVFFEYIEQNGYPCDHKFDFEQKLIVHIDGKDMELPYKTCSPYYVNNMNICFSIIFDQSGNRYLLLNRRDKGLDKIDFSENRVEIENLEFRKKTGNMIIEIRKEDR